MFSHDIESLRGRSQGRQSPRQKSKSPGQTSQSWVVYRRYLRDNGHYSPKTKTFRATSPTTKRLFTPDRSPGGRRQFKRGSDGRRFTPNNGVRMYTPVRNERKRRGFRSSSGSSNTSDRRRRANPKPGVKGRPRGIKKAAPAESNDQPDDDENEEEEHKEE